MVFRIIGTILMTMGAIADLDDRSGAEVVNIAMKIFVIVALWVI